MLDGVEGEGGRGGEFRGRERKCGGGRVIRRESPGLGADALRSDQDERDSAVSEGGGLTPLLA